MYTERSECALNEPIGARSVGLPRYQMENVQSAPEIILRVLVALVMLPIRLMVWFFVITLMTIFSLD
jgi:hypothetical protein